MQNKVLITGVCGGIGSSLAEEFSSNGFQVIGVDINEERLNSMDTLGHRYLCDLSNLSQWRICLEDIYNEQGIPEYIINNAGITTIQSFLEEDELSFSRVMRVNFDAVVISTRFWLQLITKSNEKSRIVNMASMAGYIAPASMCSYSASKHALVGFTESLQQELRVLKSSARVSLVAPGFVNTEIMQIGKGGMPSEYKFLAESPKKCAKKVYVSLLKGEDLIVPTNNAKIMRLAQRWTPKLLLKANQMIAKKVYNEME